MNDKTLQKVCAELETALAGRKFGKIFSLSRFQIAIDFRLHDSRYLFISIEPTNPRIYLIKRRLRDLEKQTKTSSAFLLLLRKHLSNAVLLNVEKLEDERIVRFELAAQNEIGETENYALIAQLTGRSANLFLLDKSGFIVDSARENSGEGQEVGHSFAPPKRFNAKAQRREDAEDFSQKDFETLSEALDSYYSEKEAEKLFQAKAQAARSKLRQEIVKREKLVKKLEQDLANHGDAAKWKRFGDLLLANISTAKRDGDKVSLTDFFDENTPTVEIEVAENLSLTEAAEKFFRRYTKARNALEAISKRLALLKTEITGFKFQMEKLEAAIAENNEEFLADILGEKAEKAPTKKGKKAETFTGARKYTSSDNFEILVGKGSKDNDFLTFRVAKSYDLWLHAADYPGSHVVVKNPTRKEIPPRTLLEAAQIAAFFSKAKKQAKVAVHYTQKKFVNKPKGAALGLVSLASFKTILVEPKIESASETRTK